MFGMDINTAKGMFFDSDKIKSAVDEGTRGVLSRFGAYVRTAAKQSIRSRKRSSAQGKPPSSHTGLLKRFIFFGYDNFEKSVVIGPVKLNAKGGNDIPEVLEFGGRSTNWKKQKVDVAARPFMGPALKQELPKLPSMWANSIKA